MGISPQQTYYNWLGRRKTGRCWLTAMKIQNADNLIKEKYKQGYEYLLPRDYKWLKQLIQLTIKLPFVYLFNTKTTRKPTTMMMP
jgi:hypothetical protein